MTGRPEIGPDAHHPTADLERSVLELFPRSGRRKPLRGLFLDQELRTAAAGEGAFVFTAFIVSMDGRIAVDDDGGGLSVPHDLANEHDWRLFQELLVQADAVVVSGRFLRERAEGKGQDIFGYLSDERHGDLRRWRSDRGLAAQPALVVVSATLDIPAEAAFSLSDRVVVATGRSAPPDAVGRIEAAGAEVVHAGPDSVAGAELKRMLADRGLRIVFSAAGPEVLHTLVADGAVDVIFATHVLRMLGGARYASLIESRLPDGPAELRLEAAYLDEGCPGPGGQIIARYRVVGA